MKQENKTTVKLSTESKLFLERGCSNYHLAHNKKITLSDFLELTQKYFKLKNDRYLEMVSMEYNNGS